MRFVLLVSLIVSCGREPSRESSRESSSDKAPPALAPTPMTTPVARATQPAGDLTQDYPSHNELIVVHYPADFAAKTVGKAVVVVSRNLPDGNDEALAFMSVAKPISDELGEFDRVVHGATIKELDHYVETSKRDAKCMGAPGIMHEGTWGTDVIYKRRVCIFLHAGHGYSFSFSYPQADPDLLLQLEHIRDATDLK